MKGMRHAVAVKICAKSNESFSAMHQNNTEKYKSLHIFQRRKCLSEHAYTHKGSRGMVRRNIRAVSCAFSLFTKELLMFDHFTQFCAAREIRASSQQEFGYAELSVEPPAMLENLPAGLIEDQI
jgi:hypothetical protein